MLLRPRILRKFGCLGAIVSLLAAAACADQPAPGYDLVIANGRVMDPESGLDAVRHVSIRGGTIEAISETPLVAARVIDATRHVVAPGFVDLHEHGQQDEYCDGDRRGPPTRTPPSRPRGFHTW